VAIQANNLGTPLRVFFMCPQLARCAPRLYSQKVFLESSSSLLLHSYVSWTFRFFVSHSLYRNVTHASRSPFLGPRFTQLLLALRFTFSQSIDDRAPVKMVVVFFFSFTLRPFLCWGLGRGRKTPRVQGYVTFVSRWWWSWRINRHLCRFAVAAASWCNHRRGRSLSNVSQ
jgi:hypothetical protein